MSAAHHCVILAGGAGRRMGRPKATVLLRGEPLAAHVAGAALEAGLEPVLVGKPGIELPDLSHRVLLEPPEPQHPLLGIATALGELDVPIVVCPCDLPNVPGALLAHLAGVEQRLVVIKAGGRMQPLLGHYEPQLADELLAAAEADAGAGATVRRLGAAVLDLDPAPGFGDPGSILANVNTVQDLLALERDRRNPTDALYQPKR